MTSAPCPDDARLTRYADRDLSAEEREAIAEHLRACTRCASHADALQAQIEALRAPLADFDVSAHVRAVMARLDAEAPAANRGRHFPRAAAVVAVAAGFALAAGYWSVRPEQSWRARGMGARPATIARDIGVQTYALEPDLRPLTPGAQIEPATPLTAGFRNLGVDAAYLLLFAVDARGQVHWISPKYEAATVDPPATRLPVSAEERLLDDSVIFDDLTPGRLRVVAVVTASVSHVSDVEALESVGASASAITRRLPHAEVRELLVEVRGANGETQP